jgi:antitoxin (DNA-binding transcriptional repressor) of toxin-antitoxin stability system
MKSKGKKISAAEFKAKWMPILDELGPERIVILKRGRVAARLKPFSGRRNEGLVGLMKGKIAVQGGHLFNRCKMECSIPNAISPQSLKPDTRNLTPAILLLRAGS